MSTAIKSNIEGLTLAQYQAEEEYFSERSKRDSIISDRVSACREHVTREVEAEWKEHLDVLYAKMKAAKDAAERAAEEQPFNGTGHEIGQTLYEWQALYRGAPLDRTGRKGVVEVITRQSAHPANISNSRARIGTVVLRVVTKKGPGMIYVKPEKNWGANEGEPGYRFIGWFPEGIDPNSKENG